MIDRIVKATGCPRANVEANWPVLEMAFAGMSENLKKAVIATVAVETGVFAPVKERRASATRQPEVWKLQERYYPSGYYGRGYIQLTWKSNYQTYGNLLGIDLEGNPDLALDPEIAAQILSLFFSQNQVDKFANAGNWVMVRKRVNGGTIGIEKFLKIIDALGE